MGVGARLAELYCTIGADTKPLATGLAKARACYGL